MSVAVNTAFFDPYHDPSRAHTAEHNWEPRWDTQMSASGRRESSSSASAQAHSTPTRAENVPRTAPQTSQLAERVPSSSSVADMSVASDSAWSSSGQEIVTPAASSNDVRQSRPAKIKVRDLEHIQSFATEDMSAFSDVRNRSRSRSRGHGDDSPQYEISEMKVEHIIEMVAGLLTKITTTNDQQHEHLHHHAAQQFDGPPHLSTHTNSVIAFHGKNIPSITILSYLSRINKYCPTSYEVFLSLLVYFDRMTERVNAGPMQSLRQANEAAMEHNHSTASSSPESATSDMMEGIITTSAEETQTATPPASGSLEKGEVQGRPSTPHSRSYQDESPPIPPEPVPVDAYDLSNFFVVDSFNIHRLVIAGVTCASKFFSDIFYTNSRYAKVGGLPLTELNHLELQFLLLNDFRLSVPVEEIEAYGTMLVEFYAREVVAQQKAAQAQLMQARSLSDSSGDSTVTVRG